MLEVTNNLLKANCDKETRMRKLCVRTYAVLPVSEKSGLLKWVEGPVPLHHLLKNYLKRDKERTAIARAIMADKGGGGAGGKEPQNVSNFVADVKQLLGAHNLDVNMSREEWPAKILIAAFQKSKVSGEPKRATTTSRQQKKKLTHSMRLASLGAGRRIAPQRICLRGRSLPQA